ncbi:carbon-nitrogen hydrolase [Helicobacter sp. 23-1044]
MELALIQHSFKGEATNDFIAESIAKSAESGANLVALQELHSFEYFCQSENVEFFKYAESFESQKAFFAKLAKAHKVVLVTSLFEKRAMGLYHNTAVVFDKDGSIAGQYRKMHIPDDPSFYEKFYFTQGDNDFAPIKTTLGKIGVLICWDQWYPEAARLMALGGAEILIYPTAIGWDLSDSDDEKKRQLNAWIAVQRGHAIANGIFVCAINRHGIETQNLSNNTQSAINFWGHSFAFGPQGEEIAMASADKDEILRICIDRRRISQVRNIWPFLRDRRIEYYHNLTKRFID